MKNLAGNAVFPTGVGMNRFMMVCGLSSSSVPHRRGDEPAIDELIKICDECSPQAWG